MNWNIIQSEEILQEIAEVSKEQKVLIFKHSTRCPISFSALNRIERNWREEDGQIIRPYFLDLIAYRSISNKIAELFGIPHESPQALLIEKGRVIYHESHMGITYPGLKEAVSAQTSN